MVIEDSCYKDENGKQIILNDMNTYVITEYNENNENRKHIFYASSDGNICVCYIENGIIYYCTDEYYWKDNDETTYSVTHTCDITANLYLKNRKHKYREEMYCKLENGKITPHFIEYN